jgi:hypothetical protein
MIRCTYRLTHSRTVVATARLERLPQKGSRIELNYQQYLIDAVSQEGDTVTVSVSEFSIDSIQA